MAAIKTDEVSKAFREFLKLTPEAQVELVKTFNPQLKAFCSVVEVKKNTGGSPKKNSPAKKKATTEADEFALLYAQIKVDVGKLSHFYANPESNRGLWVHDLEIPEEATLDQVVNEMVWREQVMHTMHHLAMRNYVAIGGCWEKVFQWHTKKKTTDPEYTLSFEEVVDKVDFGASKHNIRYIRDLRKLFLIVKTYPRFQFINVTFASVRPFLDRLTKLFREKPTEARFWQTLPQERPIAVTVVTKHEIVTEEIPEDKVTELAVEFEAGIAILEEEEALQEAEEAKAQVEADEAIGGLEDNVKDEGDPDDEELIDI